MLRLSRTLLGTLLTVLLLAGCGQKGDLYLPDEQVSGQQTQQQ